ncbi:MAG: hypothetical protein COB53_07705 [Elusimicrobia bacterium]|nr:MAG: hypothetical protein COB53_07705 [Elusimicrobiota bacterium]
MWKSVGGHDIPELNVDTQMGVAMFGGNLPAGSHVAIVNTKEHEKYFRVQYRILRPRDKKPGTVRPYHVVVVKKSILPPRFDLLHQSPE